MTLKRLNFRIAHLIIHTISCIMLLVASVNAATFTVKSGGGGDYTTIQACASAISNGDTCVVYAGTYNENVTVPAGGVGAYKTLTVNGSDVVTVISFTLNSHTKLEGNCPLSAAINTCGFNIQNPSSPTSTNCVSIADNTTDIYIDNNVMYACKYFVKSNFSANAGTNATFIRIRGNTMSYSNSTSSAPNEGTAMNLNGNHWLLENNDISHVSDGPYTAGNYYVFRGNKFHDTNTNAPECQTSGAGGNCHIDFMQADPGDGYTTQYYLFENNQVYNMVGGNSHGGPLLQYGSNTSSNAIWRYNLDYSISGGALTNDSTPGWSAVKLYNNTWVDMNVGSGNGVDGHAGACSGGADLNEIYYWSQSQSTWNAYYCQSGGCTSYTHGHSLAYSSGGGTIQGYQYGTGSFGSDTGNLSSNPQFVNYSGHNFNLASNSPALGAGTSLATVATGDSGSGTSLLLNDAGFFQDGYGFTADMVQPDCIKIGSGVPSGSNTACIARDGINYSTNTVALANSITRSPGDQVYLYKKSDGAQVLFGAAPDMGAMPSGQPSASPAPAPPTTLTSLVH